MGLDISNVTSAINDYLYSISDINKYLAEKSDSASSVGIEGLFEKYLENAIKKVSAEESADLTSDVDVTKALNSLYSLAAGNSSNSSLNAESTLSDSLGKSFSDISLPDITGNSADNLLTPLSSGLLTNRKNDSSTVQSNEAVKKADSSVSSKDSLALDITNVFSGLDIEGEIKKNISSHSANMLASQIQENIAEHNRLSESSSYNESRMSSYKSQPATGKYSDYRL